MLAWICVLYLQSGYSQGGVSVAFSPPVHTREDCLRIAKAHESIGGKDSSRWATARCVQVRIR